jgi:hypothetical protein
MAFCFSIYLFPRNGVHILNLKNCTFLCVFVLISQFKRLTAVFKFSKNAFADDISNFEPFFLINISAHVFKKAKGNVKSIA